MNETTVKVHNLIANKLGFNNIEDLKKSKEITNLTKKALNLLCESYKVEYIWK